MNGGIGRVVSAKDDEARAALTPLAPGERPPALLVAVAVAAVTAAAVVAGVLSSHELSRHGGSVPGGAFLAAVLLLLAVNMFRRRHWAVLGFEGLLAFQVLVAALALVLARTLPAAAACLAAIALGGLLFWNLIRVMGRIQVTDRSPPDHSARPRDA
jgi:anti-sigma factor RsiW